MLNHVGSKAKSAPKAPVYEIHGPSFEAKGLPRRAAVKTMIEKIHDGGVAMATIDSLLTTTTGPACEAGRSAGRTASLSNRLTIGA